MNPLTYEWLEAAQEDIIVVESLHRNDFATGAASFHAQQEVHDVSKLRNSSDALKLDTDKR